MRRMKVRRRKDRAIFRRTASRVARANLVSNSYRGGIRL